MSHIDKYDYIFDEKELTSKRIGKDEIDNLEVDEQIVIKHLTILLASIGEDFKEVFNDERRKK